MTGTLVTQKADDVRPRILGIVGGIASGKSSVAQMFVPLGARVVDADRIGHDLLSDPEIIAARAGPLGAVRGGRGGRAGPRPDRGAGVCSRVAEAAQNGNSGKTCSIPASAGSCRRRWSEPPPARGLPYWSWTRRCCWRLAGRPIATRSSMSTCRRTSGGSGRSAVDGRRLPGATGSVPNWIWTKNAELPTSLLTIPALAVKPMIKSWTFGNAFLTALINLLSRLTCLPAHRSSRHVGR